MLEREKKVANGGKKNNKNAVIYVMTLELIAYNLIFVVSKHCMLLKYDISMHLGEGNGKYMKDCKCMFRDL